MAVAKGNKITKLLCCCYKVPGLVDSILETAHLSFLQDRYVLGEQLGWGQFGVIRSCSDLVTGETLACKSISKDRLASSEDLRSVKLEIEIMAALSGHPHVVDLKAVYEEEACVHLVMELCAGGELFHRLEKHGRFSELEAQVLFQHLMEVIVYCHDKGIVHRDLKPENILLATRSSNSPIKLADFGLATYVKPGQSLHGTVGSPFYIAPEVLAGGYNQAADVWSAGVILFILLSGTPPFWGKSKSKIFDAVRTAELRFPSDPWDHVSPSAKELIAGMLCRDPAQRLTAAQVLEHSWMQGYVEQWQGPYEHDTGISSPQDLGAFSFSTSLVSGIRDISFGFGSLVPCLAQPYASTTGFTCRSFFSAFADANPCSPIGFSFHSSCETRSDRFPTPIPSMPSFAFSSPHSPNEHETQLASATNTSEGCIIQRDSSFEKLIMSPNLLHRREPEHKKSDARRGMAISSRANGVQSKRNHTIGLGELEQLHLVVSESVIRWRSCTHLPSAPSLVSSLVC